MIKTIFIFYVLSFLNIFVIGDTSYRIKTSYRGNIAVIGGGTLD